MELVDIGVNLVNSAFRDDCEAVVARAIEVGVTTMVITGTSVAVSATAADIAQASPALYSTAGVHPHDAGSWTSESADQLRALADRQRVVAIGETGLDFYRNYATRREQEHAFAAQLELAADSGLPVFLHERDAHERQLAILKPCHAALSGAVAHCFTGSEGELDRYLSLGFYIGITGWICNDRRGQALQGLVRRIPIDRLLLETDAPYLLPRTITPKPKSRRNEPAFLAHVLETVATCVGRPIQEVAAATTANAKRLFGFSDFARPRSGAHD